MFKQKNQKKIIIIFKRSKVDYMSKCNENKLPTSSELGSLYFLFYYAPKWFIHK